MSLILKYEDQFDPLVGPVELAKARIETGLFFHENSLTGMNNKEALKVLLEIYEWILLDVNRQFGKQ